MIEVTASKAASLSNLLVMRRDFVELGCDLLDGALLTAQRTFSQTNLNYLEAPRELCITEAEIDGLLLRGSLEAQ